MDIYNETIRDANNLIDTPKLFVMKRSGTRVPFTKDRIINAIRKANNEIGIVQDMLTEEQIFKIAENIEHTAARINRDLSVEEIQDMVENELMFSKKTSLARAYITYRYKRNERRKGSLLDNKIKAIIDCTSEEAKQENSNKNPTIASVQRDYIAGEWSRQYTKMYLLPKDIQEADAAGIIHFHDSDYFAQHMTNCCLINLEDMFQNRTRISGTRIDTPKSFTTASTVSSQIIAQVASLQYGGQTITLSHLAPFVNVSRKKWFKRLAKEWDDAGITYTPEQLEKVVHAELLKELESGCQTIQYQLITLQTTNGQAPFVTVFMYLNEVPEGQTRDDLALLIEIMLKQRLQGVKDESGAYITPAFPKLIYVLEENNIHPESKYWYLTELAAKCSAKRMVPDYISEKIMTEIKGTTFPAMGCRSMLTPDRFSKKLGNIANAGNYNPDKPKYYGRFNQGVVTLNLVDVACSSHGDEEIFWKLMEDRLELCHRALRLRHERLLGTPSDIAPTQWQDGSLARLKPGETIDKLLYNGYSTLSLGYAGLAECVYYMKHMSHIQGEGKTFGLAVMQKLNDKCNEWKEKENIDYSVYGTPLESTTYKFAKCLQTRFGIIPHVTDKNYITNSYHIHVTEDINAFDKLSIEAEFQKLSPGGAVSYVEVPDMTNNIPAVLSIIQHIYNTILYAELNTKSDLCLKCGYDGEIKIIKDGTRWIWECPNCKNRDQKFMHLARRTCGYVGTQGWNQGRTQEIAERKLHVGIIPRYQVPIAVI